MIMTKSTNWTSATLNPFVALLSLISCLRAGYNAWIELQENGKQDFPLTEKNPDLNKIENWKSSGAFYCSDWATKKKEIENNKKIHPMEQNLLLNYTTVFGSEEEYNHYLKTGEVKFLGMGKCYFVKYDDLIKTRLKEGIVLSDNTRFVLMVSPIPRIKIVRKLKRKVFVICSNKDKVKLPLWLKVLNVFVFPLRFIPSFSLLKMPEYTVYTFRIGDITNGFEITFKIPKKFSLK